MAAPLVAGTPCTITARACVDLDSQRAWLFSDGGDRAGEPVKVASGWQRQRPRRSGTRCVSTARTPSTRAWSRRSRTGNPRPCPGRCSSPTEASLSTTGSPTRSSAGCIHLADPDARAWFNYMAIGDQVQVVKASQELPRHKAQPAVSKKAGRDRSAPRAARRLRARPRRQLRRIRRIRQLGRFPRQQLDSRLEAHVPAA